MANKRIIVTEESDTGRNLEFQDVMTGEKMTRVQLVKEIEKGSYQDYHIRKIHGVKTPVSNPDESDNNNLD